MRDADKIRLHDLAMWLAIVGLAIWIFGFVFLADFVPPIPPSRDASQVAAFFWAHRTGIIVMCMMLIFTACLIMPFFGVISVQLRRIEGCNSHLAYSQIIIGTIAAALFAPSAMLWVAAVFRPERSPQEILLLNDISWLLFVMPGAFGSLQLLVIGLGILMDRRTEPLYPRWIGYLNLWTAVLIIPSVFVAIFRTGPFAWNGLIAFWIPATFYLLWWVVMLVFTFKAVRKPDEVLRPETVPV